MSESRSTRADLQRQRDEVAQTLESLDKTRADAVQKNSFARARERAGVTDRASGEADQLKADEAAAHEAMRDARAEMQRLDMEIENQPREGLGGKVSSALGRFRRPRA